MKTIHKGLKIILSIILGLVALYSISIIVQKIIWKDKVPSIFGYKNFIVLTGSMEPSLNIGDIVFVKETEDIQEQDIISFRLNHAVVTHRVVEIIEEDGVQKYITKGDANSGKDAELLTIEDIEGKYVFKIPKLGVVINFMKTPTGMIFTLFIIGLVLFIPSLKSDTKGKEKAQ